MALGYHHLLDRQVTSFSSLPPQTYTITTVYAQKEILRRKGVNGVATWL